MTELPHPSSPGCSEDHSSRGRKTAQMSSWPFRARKNKNKAAIEKTLFNTFWLILRTQTMNRVFSSSTWKTQAYIFGMWMRSEHTRHAHCKQSVHNSRTLVYSAVRHQSNLRLTEAWQWVISSFRDSKYAWGQSCKLICR